MRKYIYIYIAILITQFVNAQTDEVNKPSNITHLAGVDVGYTTYGEYINNNGEINLNYVFNPHYFCVKSQVGIAPGTAYGNLTKIIVSLGFSTKIYKPISWHLLTGIGLVTSTQPYYNRTLSAGGLFIETGFYVKPSKTKRHVFGLNISELPMELIPTSRWAAFAYGGPAFNINISYNLKLNK